MHGGLHLYDANTEIRKFCWRRTGIRLKEQILTAINDGMYPLFVAEGKHSEKFTKINHNSYLTRCYRSFQAKGGVLFIFGLGLKENDDHICEAIIEGKYKVIFVSLYGDINSKENNEIKARLEHIANAREQRESKKERNSRRYIAKKLDIFTFQAGTAKVWG
jgi:hypothetical protein